MDETLRALVTVLGEVDMIWLHICFWIVLFIFISPHLYKIYKANSKIDFFLVFILFLLLIVPTFYINNNIASEKENRKLAQYKPFITIKKHTKKKLNTSYKINYNYGKDYEKWLNDRFLGRNTLIYLYNNLVYRVSLYVYKSNNDIFIKRDKYFLGSKGHYHLNKKDADKIIENFKTFKDYLDNKGIKFYIVSVPHKGYLLQNKNIEYKSYEKANPLNIKDYPNSNEISLLKLSEILNDEYNINYIDMLETFYYVQNNDLVYYKTDHHPTDYGFYLIYQELMKVIKNDFPDIKINTIDDFNLSKNKKVRYNDKRNFQLGIEHQISMINDDKIFDTEYTYFDYKKLNNININIINAIEHKHINPNGKYKTLLIGDSFIFGFVYFLDTSFHDIMLYRVNYKRYPFEVEPMYKWIDEFKPDIVIFLRNTGGILNYIDMYPEKKQKSKSKKLLLSCEEECCQKIL